MGNESGRSMIEMILVLAIIGILGIGSIGSFYGARTKSDVGRIEELASVASLTALTRIKTIEDSDIWGTIGKKKTDYPCIDTMRAENDGTVKIRLKNTSGCEKIRNMAQESSILSENGGEYQYQPPAEDDE